MTNIIITTHATQRFSERMPFIPVQARAFLASCAFESENNSMTTSGAMGAFLRYYAEKYSQKERYMVTEYNGYLFVFHRKRRTLITVIDDHDKKAYKAFISYAFSH